MYYSINHAGIGISMVIGYGTAVLVAYMLGRAISRELMTRNKLASLGIGLIAVYFSSITGANTLALGAAVLSGFVTAVDIIALQKLKFGVLQAAGLSWFAVAITSLPLAALFHESLPGISHAKAWILLGAFTATSLLASWIHTTGLRKVEANIVGLLGLLEIVFAVLFGTLLFNEHVGFLQAVGVALILVACAIPYLSQGMRDKPVALL
jgi:drug/metabolite transporter (DMT)-like permease